MKHEKVLNHVNYKEPIKNIFIMLKKYPKEAFAIKTLSKTPSTHYTLPPQSPVIHGHFLISNLSKEL